MLWILALATAAAAPSCPEPMTPGALSALGDQAVELFLNGRVDELHALTQRADQGLPCLDGPLGVAEATSWHQLHALDAFTRVDDQATTASFRALLAIAPAYQLPEALRANGFLRQALEQARDPAEAQPETVAVPRPYELVVDGVPSDRIPRAWTPVVQARRQSGALLWSEVLAPNEAVKLDLPRRHATLLIPAGVLAVGSAGLGVWALQTVHDPPSHDTLAALDSQARADTLQSWEDGLRGLDIAAVGTAAGALGLGVLWYTVRW